MRRPVVGLTMGDPAGIGPELCLRAACAPEVLAEAKPIIFGSHGLLARVAKRCGLKVPAAAGLHEAVDAGKPAVVDCVPDFDPEHLRPGIVQPEAGRAAWLCVREAASAALRGLVSAVVTAPLNKEALQSAGVPYPGHTEMLASLTGVRKYCMMLYSPEISVSLATTHVALSKVSSLLTPGRIMDVIELTESAVRSLTLRRKPHIVVCALNPHSGEGGLFGCEEERIIAPAVRKAESMGIDVDGPVSPDTAFLPERMASTDAYVVMYHDQGLIPFKMLAFDRGVNITLGLPIIRTSPDHGTAFDIAWKGAASAASFMQSIRVAVRLARRRTCNR